MRRTVDITNQLLFSITHAADGGAETGFTHESTPCIGQPTNLPAIDCSILSIFAQWHVAPLSAQIAISLLF
jgi:hypothetical protein